MTPRKCLGAVVPNTGVSQSGRAEGSVARGAINRDRIGAVTRSTMFPGRDQTVCKPKREPNTGRIC